MRPSSGGSRRISKWFLPACGLGGDLDGEAGQRHGGGLRLGLGRRGRPRRRRLVRWRWPARRRRDFAPHRRRLWRAPAASPPLARARRRRAWRSGRRRRDGIRRQLCRRCLRACAVLAGFDLRHRGLRIGGRCALGRGVGRLVALRLRPGFVASGLRRAAWPPAACNAASASASPACRLRRGAAASGERLRRDGGYGCGRPPPAWRHRRTWRRARRPVGIRLRLLGLRRQLGGSLGASVSLASLPASAALASLRFLGGFAVVGVVGRLAVLGVGAVFGRLGVGVAVVLAGLGWSARSAFRALGPGLPRRARRRLGGGGAVEQVGERGGRLLGVRLRRAAGAGRRGGGTAGRCGLRTRRGARRTSSANGDCSFVCNRRATRRQKIINYFNGLM